MTLRHALLLLAVACSSRDKPVEPSAAADPGSARPDDLPQLGSNAPEDREVRDLTAQQRERSAELAAQARKSYPDAKRRYLAGLPAGEHFFVVATLRSPGESEDVFIAVESIANGQVKGLIANDLRAVKGYSKGAPFTFAEDELLDWLIAKPDGSEEGNLVGKYLDSLH